MPCGEKKKDVGMGLLDYCRFLYKGHTKFSE